MLCNDFRRWNAAAPRRSYARARAAEPLDLAGLPTAEQLAAQLAELAWPQ